MEWLKGRRTELTGDKQMGVELVRGKFSNICASSEANHNNVQSVF